MRSQELKNMRQMLGLERLEFARLIGFTGTDRNDVTRIRQYEGSHGKKQIPLYIARFVWLLLAYKAETGRLPVFPVWDGYDYDHTPDPGHEQEKKNAEFY